MSNLQVANYCTFKEEHPEIHQDVNPMKLKHIGEEGVMEVPSYRSADGRRILIYRMGNWNPRKFGIEDIFKATLLVLELGILEPRAQVLGGIVIFDLRNITLSHAWAMTPQVCI